MEAREAMAIETNARETVDLRLEVQLAMRIEETNSKGDGEPTVGDILRA